ncbi:MAG: SDR family NAD(P)-dependent oxidoreductase [Gemmataceae bacterium]|nr:SDR family NAD(P)-dependent oxidoreductase [Gemmataceae bacterium]
MALHCNTALITGAASGIGRELARQLADEGVAIAALDLNADGLQALADELTQKQRRVAWGIADVTKADELQARVSALEMQLGPIDLLIACAGIGFETSALEYRADAMNAVLAVNLIGVSNSIAAVLPGMLERRRGHIVALSSLASYLGVPRMLAYCASKSGVNAIMEGLRAEVRQHGIHATTICPGWVRTPMTDGKLPGHVRTMPVDDAARRIIRAIRRRKTFVAFPAALVWQMRLLTWSPRFVRDRLIARMQREYPREPNPREPNLHKP